MAEHGVTTVPYPTLQHSHGGQERLESGMFDWRVGRLGSPFPGWYYPLADGMPPS